MDQRKRLIKLIKHCTSCEECRDEDIADHLLANGVIVPPVKVGDTVYRYSEDFGTVLPYFVENLQIGFLSKTENYWVYEANCHSDETDELLDEIDFGIDDIGKSIFLTKEQAEKALSERSNR